MPMDGRRTVLAGPADRWFCCPGSWQAMINDLYLRFGLATLTNRQFLSVIIGRDWSSGSLPAESKTETVFPIPVPGRWQRNLPGWAFRYCCWWLPWDAIPATANAWAKLHSTAGAAIARSAGWSTRLETARRSWRAENCSCLIPSRSNWTLPQSKVGGSARAGIPTPTFDARCHSITQSAA